MPDPITEPTAATLDLSKFFGPTTEETVSGPPAAPVADPAVVVPPAELDATKVEPPKPEPVVEAQSEIAAALNEWRAEKKTAETARAEVQSWKGKYEATVAEMEALKKAPSFEDDPIAYVKARKWTPEQQTEIVQLLAYDLAPEKAPTDFRFKILESKQAREKAREQAEREAQAAQAAQAEALQIHQAFIGSLEAATSTFSPGAYSANEDWYGENRQAYVSDLYNLANELAEEATAKGERADLSAATLAAKLEQRNAEKLTALVARRSKRTAPAAPPEKPADVAKQSDSGPVSTHGLNQGGPRPPAMSDEERVRRATLAAFGGRGV